MFQHTVSMKILEFVEYNREVWLFFQRHFKRAKLCFAKVGLTSRHSYSTGENRFYWTSSSNPI